MSVRLTKTTRAQLHAAYDYLHARSPAAARDFRERVGRRLLQLRRFPGIGHPVPEAPDGSLRQILVDAYRIVYRLTGRVVLVVGIWHGAQLATLPEDAAAPR